MERIDVKRVEEKVDAIPEEERDIILIPGDVARMLNIHINTVRRWSNLGVLKSFRIGPRGDRRFLKEDIDKFLRE